MLKSILISLCTFLTSPFCKKRAKAFVEATQTSSIITLYSALTLIALLAFEKQPTNFLALPGLPSPSAMALMKLFLVD